MGHYKRKTEGPSYSKETLNEAVEAVRSGRMSGYEAASTYNIPRKTIMDHVTGRRGQKSSTRGRPPALSCETEQMLANCLHIMERNGFGLSRNEVLELVGEYVKINNLKTPFTDGVPGKDWFSDFKKRCGLSIKKPQAVEAARKKAADPFIIQEYYDMLERVVNELGLQNKPERIYNLDETSYCSDPQKTKVVGLKGFPSTRTTSSSGKSNTTVLMASNAAGEKGPPFIIFKGKHVWSNWTSDLAYPGTLYTATSNGWIESEAFLEYFEKSFIPMIGDNTQPTLLIYDGHSTHVQIALIEKAKQHNITIIKLPAHTSHLLQPLDLAVFKPYKDAWDQEMVKWQRSHNGEKLPKHEFSRIVGKVWENLNPNIIKNGFIKGGIYPFNRNAVPEHKLDQEALKRWKKQNMLSNDQTLPRYSPCTLTELCLKKINLSFNTSPVTSLTCDINSKNTGKISFEDLLLQTMKQIPTGNVKKKQVRVSGSAEVITHDDVIQRLKKKEDDRLNKEKKKEENRKIRENKKKLQLNKQIEKKDKEKGKKNELKSKRIEHKNSTDLSDPITNDNTDPCSSSSFVQQVQNSYLQKPKISKPKTTITILQDQYLQSNEKLAYENLFLGRNTIRPTDIVLKSTDIKAKKINFKSENNCMQSRKKKQKKLKEEDLSTDSEFSLHDSDSSDVKDLGSYIDKYLTEHDSEEEIDNMSFGLSDIKYYEEVSHKFKEQDWILVKFAAKKSVKHYVGQIININNDIPMVKYVRKTQTKLRSLHFVYPNVDDICELLQVEDIVSILPKPIISRRGQISFCVDFGTFNVQ